MHAEEAEDTKGEASSHKEYQAEISNVNVALRKSTQAGS